MKNRIASLVAVTLVSKLLAFGQQLLLAYYYGVSDISDVYVIAITIPVTIFGFISFGVIAGFIPAYKKEVQEKDRQAGLLFANKIAGMLLIFSSFVILVYFLSGGNIVSIFAGGFHAEKKALTIEYANITIFAIAFIAETTVFDAFLQAEGRTIYSGVVSIPLNLVVVAFIVISHYTERPIFLVIGFLIGSVVQSLVLYGIARKHTFRFSFEKKIFDSSLKNFIINLGILTIGSSISQINVLIDKTIASGIASGGVTALEYGNRIFDLISGVFIISISTTQYPRMVEKQDGKEYGAFIETCLMQIYAVILPIALFVLFFSKETVGVIYGRGAFDSTAVDLTASVVVFYGVGFVFIGFREILARAFYAKGDTKTPVVNSIIGLVINIILNYILSSYMGIGGLALATSIAAVCTSVALLIQISARTHYLILINKIKGILVIAISCLALIFAARYSYRFLSGYMNYILLYLLIGFLYITAYLLILTRFKVFDVFQYMKSFLAHVRSKNDCLSGEEDR